MSRAAERALKFVLGAVFGFVIGWQNLDAIREAPFLLGGFWVLGILATGWVGLKVFNVAGKFRLTRNGETNRLSPGEEVVAVIGMALAAVVMWIWMG